MAIVRTGAGTYKDTATGRVIQGAANPAAAAARFQNMTTKGTNIAADNRPTPAPTPGGNGGSSPQPVQNQQMPTNQAPQNMPAFTQNGMPMGSGGQAPMQPPQQNLAQNANYNQAGGGGYMPIQGGGYGTLGMNPQYAAQPNIMQTQNPQATAAGIAANMYGQPQNANTQANVQQYNYGTNNGNGQNYL